MMRGFQQKKNPTLKISLENWTGVVIISGKKFTGAQEFPGRTILFAFEGPFERSMTDAP
jgi:hypothetical protein